MSADPRDGVVRWPAGAPPERLDRALRALRPELSWGAVRALVARGKVFVDGAVAVDPAMTVGGGCELAIELAARRLAPAAVAPFPAERLLLVDRRVVVVDKPAGVDTVAWADERDTLVARVRTAVGGSVRVVQRLDRDTTGALVFARDAEAEQHLSGQLRRRSVHRRYLALVHGAAAAGTIRSYLAADRGDRLRGSVDNRKVGKEAVTHVEVVERLAGATLVSCRLETGRTHQIRIHLAEQGHMLLGERGYLREHRGPRLAAPRIMLHAAELGFRHPDGEAMVQFHVPLPADMRAVLAALRAQAGQGQPG